MERDLPTFNMAAVIVMIMPMVMFDSCRMPFAQRACGKNLNITITITAAIGISGQIALHAGTTTKCAKAW